MTTLLINLRTYIGCLEAANICALFESYALPHFCRQLSYYLKHLLIGLICIFITSCGSIISDDTTLTINKDERWEIQNQILLSDPTVRTSGFLVKQSLSKMISDLQKDGLDAKWEQLEPDPEGNVPFQIFIRGQGYGKLNDILGEGVLEVDESTGQRRIHFIYNQDSEISLNSLHSTFTLKGGRILSSNGVQVNRTTVQWSNPREPLEAVFMEPTGFSWTTYLFIFATIGIAIGLFVIVRKSTSPISKQQYMPSFTPNRKIETPRYCSRCNSAFPREARFCPHCGNKE